MHEYLSGIRPGDRREVTRLCGSTLLTKKLRDFGMVPGTLVRCCYLSPGEHLMALELRGSVIALRRRDLEGIQVKCVEG